MNKPSEEETMRFNDDQTLLVVLFNIIVNWALKEIIVTLFSIDTYRISKSIIFLIFGVSSEKELILSSFPNSQ